MRRRPGYTLIELTFVLLIMALLASVAAPPVLHARDVLAVRAARSELVSTIATARSAAVLAGGATLLIEVPEGRLRIEAPDGTVLAGRRDLSARYGIRLESSRGPQVSIHFDALGIGRLASASFSIQRGTVSGAVTVSAYGRVRT